MSKHYTDEDVAVAVARLRITKAHTAGVAFGVPVEAQGLHADHVSRAVLDAVAPAIAARALRLAAMDYGQERWSNKDAPQFLNAETWLLNRANQADSANSAQTGQK